METTVNSNGSCDLSTGICELQGVEKENQKKLRLVYFTDPICSSCWGIEPQLKKLVLEYGDHFNIEYRMGGLLESWQSYGGNDVSGPASVASHWEQAGVYYEMPINGDVWYEDPLQSSYPASIAFKAAQMQDEIKAIKFLRRIREMVFVEKKNISRNVHLTQAAKDSGLDMGRFLTDYAGDAIQLFEEDMKMTRIWNVRGFPTIFFLDEDGNRLKLHGSKNYDEYERALLSMLPANSKKVVPSIEILFEMFGSFAPKELSVIQEKNISEINLMMEDLANRSHIARIGSGNKYIWKVS